MKTSKPVSTISYNTPRFLLGQLDGLLQSGKISFYAFIVHKGEEDDEAGTQKDHIHLYVEPARNLQTDDLTRELLEIDPNKPAKPLKCLPWQNSKRWGDWYLYALHDKRYLASKSQARQFHYTDEHFFTSDIDYFTYKCRNIDYMQLDIYSDMLDFIEQNQSIGTYVKCRNIPISQLAFIERAWKFMAADIVERNGRQNPVDIVEDVEPCNVVETPFDIQ